ncbi:MAG: hypothetical protein NVS3B26_02470 [Mycobacteriales bacterium]
MAATHSAVSRLASLVPLSFHAVGPDVSSHQHNGRLDWRRVRRTRGFAIIKATQGVGYVNPYFASDWAAAGRAKLPRGAYDFADPAWPVSTADDEARAFAAAVGPMNRPGDLPPVLDLELSGGLTAGQLVLWTQEWMRAVRGLTGRTPMLYTYRNFWPSQVGDTHALADDGIPLWIADYNGGRSPGLIGGWRTWTMWQYTSAGVQAGISGRVDLSKFHGGVAAMRSFASGRSAAVPRFAPSTPSAAASADSGQLVVSWIPGADGWAAPTGWSVRIEQTGEIITADAGQTAITVAHAPVGVPLTAVVTARSSLGSSAPSAPSTPVVLRASTSLVPLSAPQTVPVGTEVIVRFQLVSPDSPVSGRPVSFVALPTLGGPAEPLGSAITGSDGTVAIAAAPHQGVGIVATFNGSDTQLPSRSGSVSLRVTPTVTVAAPVSAVAGPVRLTGWTDAPVDTPIVVEVATATGWEAVGQTLAASAGFTVTAVRPAGPTTWRAVVLETAGSLRAQSSPTATAVTPLPARGNVTALPTAP